MPPVGAETQSGGINWAAIAGLSGIFTVVIALFTLFASTSGDGLTMSAERWVTAVALLFAVAQVANSIYRVRCKQFESGGRLLFTLEIAITACLVGVAIAAMVVGYSTVMAFSLPTAVLVLTFGYLFVELLLAQYVDDTYPEDEKGDGGRQGTELLARRKFGRHGYSFTEWAERLDFIGPVVLWLLKKPPHRGVSRFKQTLFCVLLLVAGMDFSLAGTTAVAVEAKGGSPTTTTTTTGSTTTSTSTTTSSTTTLPPPPPSSAVSTTTTTTTTLPLSKICGTSSLALPSSLEGMRKPLEKRWHKLGGTVIGCQDGSAVSLPSGGAVVFFHNGMVSPAALVATPSMSTASFVQGVRVELLHKYLRTGELQDVSKEVQTPASNYQLFLLTTGCVMSINTYGLGPFKLDETATAAVIDVTTTVGGWIQSLSVATGSNGSEIAFTLNVDGQEIPVSLIEAGSVRVVSGPIGVAALVVPVGASCPDEAVQEFLSQG